MTGRTGAGTVGGDVMLVNDPGPDGVQRQMAGVTGSITSSLVNRRGKGHIMTTGGAMDGMAIEIGTMTVDTLSRRIITGRGTDPGSIGRQIMTGRTPRSAMNIGTTGERSTGRYGMTTITVRGGRGLQDIGTEEMSMTVVIEVTGMAVLTIVNCNRAGGAALQGAVAGQIMTGSAGSGVMGLTGADERGGGRGMAGQTESYRGQSMTMGMIIEVTGMTGLTVLTAGCARCTALEGTGSGVMTGKTTEGCMDLTDTIVWSCGGGMTSRCTERYTRQSMGVAMIIEITGMTGGTVLTASRSRSATLEGTGSGIMAGETT